MESLSRYPLSWSAPERVLFRFFFLLFSLFILCFNNGAYPFFDVVMTLPLDGLQRFIPWLAREVLHLPYEITVFTNGSGDTTYDYLCLLCIFTLSVAGCLIWSLLDRKRAGYSTLFYWLTVAVRFYVALMLVNYGLAKLFKFQFPAPGPSRLSQTYGSSSPMGLAWTFLGFSKGYNIFMGLAELAALLLLFRRTVAIGAIICLMTTANVMAVNYFFDVPVKIVSTALVIFSLFLLAPNFRPLLQLFFRGQPARLRLVPPPAYTRTWVRYGLRAAKALVFVYVLWGVYESYDMLSMYGDSAPRPPMYGLYNVRSFRSSAHDSLHWKQLIIERPGYAAIRMQNDSMHGYYCTPDTLARQLALSTFEDTATVYRLRYTSAGSHLALYGRLEKDSIAVQLDRYDHQRYRLMSRGFHWISEYPYNR